MSKSKASRFLSHFFPHSGEGRGGVKKYASEVLRAMARAGKVQMRWPFRSLMVATFSDRSTLEVEDKGHEERLRVPHPGTIYGWIRETPEPEEPAQQMVWDRHPRGR